MAWEAWRVPAWSYPKAPLEVDFHSLLVPTVDSTRALAVIHQMQVRDDAMSSSAIVACLTVTW